MARRNSTLVSALTVALFIVNVLIRNQPAASQQAPSTPTPSQLSTVRLHRLVRRRLSTGRLTPPPRPEHPFRHAMHTLFLDETVATEIDGSIVLGIVSLVQDAQGRIWAGGQDQIVVWEEE